MKEIILSICIPLHNRSEHLIGHLRKILRVDSDEFDVIISDTSEEGKRLADKYPISDDKLKVFYAPETVPAMENWYLALEHADGVFALHLNDRDRLNCGNLLAFIGFLKEHRELSGGVCKYLAGHSAPVICESLERSLLCVPYFALHTTGQFFHVQKYKSIPDRKELFSFKKGTHPHDLLQGRLFQFGMMAIYTDLIWEMASHDFYRNNKSGFELKKGLYFEPEQRLYELKEILKELDGLGVEPGLREKKRRQTIMNYLLLATYNYFYYIQSDHETKHYGIERQELSAGQKRSLINSILADFGRELGFSRFDYIRYRLGICGVAVSYKINGAIRKIPSERLRVFLFEIRTKRRIRAGTVLR